MAYSFIPTLFISIGEKTCFFTLRETYEQVIHIPGEGSFGNCVINGSYQGSTRTEIRSFHHFNLSQDPDEAIAKATVFAAEMGLELTTTRDRLVEEMKEIKRADAAEMERRAKAEAQRKADYQAYVAEENLRMRQVIAAGFFPFGRFSGLAFEKAEPSYLQWVIAKREDFEADSYMRLIADKLAAEYAEFSAPQFDPDATIGEIGERLELEIKVVRSFSINTDFGTSYIVTMVTNSNICLISFGKFYAEVGEILKIKGTVKCHDQYKGQMQTRLQRVKIIN